MRALLDSRAASHWTSRMQLRPIAIAIALTVAVATLAAPVQAQRRGKAPARKPAVVVSPACTDFYSHANESWLATHPAPVGGAASALADLATLAERQQRDLLDAAMTNPQGQVQKLLGDFWASGLDEAAIDRDGANPVAPLLKRIDGIRRNRDIAPAVAALHQVGIPVLFNFAADIDLRALDRHVGYFMQGGTGLPDPGWYTRNDAATQAVMTRYAEYVQKILQLTGVPVKTAAADARAVVEMEARIARASRKLADLRDPRANFNAVPTAGLAKQYPNLQLDAFLKAQGVNDDIVSIANPALFAELNAMAGTLKPAQWKNYLRWRVGDAMAPYLAKPWRDASFEFRNRVLLGQSVPDPRWKQALAAINTAAGPMLGREYAARHLPDATRRQAVAIADQVRDTMIRQLATRPWMSEATRQAAQTKLRALRIEVGAPRRDLDYTIQPMGRGSFGSNVLIASTWRHQQEMRRIGGGDAGRRWDVLPHQPALAYDLAQNRLIVTAAILQAPVLSASMPPAAQYGAYGALVGHELSHAVDMKGRMVDPQGGLHDWWTPADFTAWDTLGQRVIAQYNAYAYPALAGSFVNGIVTREENMADLAGVELAHTAMRAALPAGGTAADDAFYRAWAQLWAQNLSPEVARQRAQEDVRAPGQWRVNAVLANQPAFAAAFACKAGNPMQRSAEEQISLWR